MKKMKTIWKLKIQEDEDNNDDKYVPTMKEFDADAARGG